MYSGYKKEVVTSDTDGDGRLDKEELARLREKVGDNQELIALIDDADKNKDQQLSTAETRELLKKIDAVSIFKKINKKKQNNNKNNK